MNENEPKQRDNPLQLMSPGREALNLDDFTEEDIAALEVTRAPESSKAFDHELAQDD